ncbi:MAG TPA: dihydrofolate reductase [Tenuifilaceae bacterium]|nr:dihydrofolate reductase [Tenuifilaceae bacterium]HPE18645.1 dihydrofolate reductase [Tenuifilaceae bacterium]HPJ46073.1 dihydrofolate reductase [Tenuifilaceae bacterium]HPQ34417.1 dihydrofolate reductase [Tenuifilaceae bacterium]HRX67813.1 dihydrofolate reductase [Tenuifilaceae bacterium]
MISIIVAIAENNVIGKNNQLIWHISEDLKRFKLLTTGHCIIMGRKTFESIGKALPKRTNIVVSRNEKYRAEGCQVVNSLETALGLCPNYDEVFIIGGGELYREALPLAKKLYITRIHRAYEGDTYFPEIDENTWIAESIERKKPADSSEPEYTFVNYVRR